jgi:HlyD family secretion protein
LLLLLGGAGGCGPGREEQKIAKTAVAAEEYSFDQAITATGTLKPVGEVKVGSQLSGRISEISVDFNDDVTNGQVLAVLDQEKFKARVREAQAVLEVERADVRLQEAAVLEAESALEDARFTHHATTAELESAEAQVLEARRDLERKRQLSEQGVLSEHQLDQAGTSYESLSALARAHEARMVAATAKITQAEAAVAMAKARLANASAEVNKVGASLEQAEVDLSRTMIRSPINGVVIRRDVEPGQTVAASLEAPTLFTLAKDLRRMEVHARIDEADIGSVTRGQRASFVVDAFPAREFGGRVTQVRKAPEVVQHVVTYTVVISADNQDFALLPGMTAIIRIKPGDLKSSREASVAVGADAIAGQERPPGTQGR